MRNQFIFCISYLLFFIWTGTLHAQPIRQGGNIFLTDSLDEQLISPSNLLHYQDISNELTINNIQQADSRFHFGDHFRQLPNNPDRSYWVRFDIQIDSLSEKLWLMEFYDQNIDYLTVYLPQKDGSYQEAKMGDALPFSLREFRHKNYITPLRSHVNLKLPVYVKIQSNHKVSLDVAFRSTNRFTNYALKEYTLLGMLYSGIIIMIIYNLLVWLAIQERKYIYYILYLLAVGLYSLSQDGMGFQFLWPSYPAFNQWAFPIGLVCLLSSYFLLITNILELRKENTEKYRKYRSLGGLLLCTFIALMPSYWNIFTSKLPEFIGIAGILYILLEHGRPNKVTNILLTSTLIILTGFSVRILLNLGFIEFTPVTHYSTVISISIQILLISRALSERLHLLKDQEKAAQLKIIEEQQRNKDAQEQIIEEQQKRIQLKRMINKELEKKVSERTATLKKREAELFSANEALTLANSKLNEVNRSLDVNNFQLKDAVLKERENRFVNKLISYGEFQELFPDTLSCHRYLQSLKWDTDFSCKKCRNDKYFEGAKKFSRRCTKCGYDESITAHTVFQGIKFDINKAFYLCYLFEHYPEKYSFQQLSDLTGIRKNTVWNFRKKVEKSPEKGLLTPSFTSEQLQRIYAK